MTDRRKEAKGGNLKAFLRKTLAAEISPLYCLETLFYAGL